MGNKSLYITDVPGFRAAGVHAGLKKDGQLDVALIASERPCVAAAVFTQNLVKAAPVLFDQEILATAATQVYAVAINAKNANAVTGDQGLRDAAEMARLTGAALGLPDDGAVLVMSTGVIGVPMPMPTIARGIELAAQALTASDEGGEAAARAIMTTDTFPKTAGRQLTLSGGTVTIAGMAKGAGMIHPNMATMLGLIATDANIPQPRLQALLSTAAERSFNCITVDGDTSTNDTLMVLANGAGPAVSVADEPLFGEALLAVCTDLAMAVARDGEGATKFVTIHVSGTQTFEEARAIGRTIATSPLVKTAIFGRDANWGRVLAAAGRSGVAFDPGETALWMGTPSAPDALGLLVDGTPQPFDEALALALLSEHDIEIRLVVGRGSGSASVWTCDFSFDYVSVNADYRT